MVDFLTTLGITDQSLSGLISSIAVFLLIGLCFFILACFISVAVLFNIFRYKALIFPGFGDTNNIDKLILGTPKFRKVRYIQKHGSITVQLLKGFYKTNPIGPELIYPEGIYLIQIGKEFMPIAKPAINIEKNFLINMGTYQSWKEANFIMYKKYRTKFADRDEKMRVFALFIIACILIIVFAGFVLWLSFSNVNRLHADLNVLADAIKLGSAMARGPTPG